MHGLAVGEPEGGSAFVHLRSDHERSAQPGYERGSVSFETRRDLDPLLFSAVLQAVLARYTQQESLPIDLLSLIEGGESSSARSSPRFDQATHRRITWLANGDLGSTLTQSMQDLACLFRDPNWTSSPGAARSNIGICLPPGLGSNGLDWSVPGPYDLLFVLPAVGSEESALLVFNAALFKRSTMERLCGHLRRVLEQVPQFLDLPFWALPLLSERESARMIEAWSSGSSSYPDAPVHLLFQARAAERPDAIALLDRGEVITYRELARRSERLAELLLRRGVRVGARVAVCVKPGAEILVAMLAVFKVGAVYVPLDPSHPTALIASILEEAAPELVITQSPLTSITEAGGFPQWCFDLGQEELASPSLPAADVEVSLEHGAYMLYTSGTTGKPKGVIATHRNLAQYLHVAAERYGFSAADRFVSLARYTFSISMFELLSPLRVGASLKLLSRDDVLAPERLTEHLADITVMHAGPSLLTNLFRHLKTRSQIAPCFPNMRHASSGGDLVPPALLEEMKSFFPNAELFVIYGCTEISCMGTTYPVERSLSAGRSAPAEDRYYVGKPFPNVTVRLFDTHHNLVPLGAVGEICFAGDGVVAGYHLRPELNREKFLELEGKRFYCTGDLGRFDEAGNLEILGRRDFQIQLRGIRIELNGIENTVRSLGLAAQCAVVLRSDAQAEPRLVAFLVDPRERSIVALRRALAEHLPDYMLPQSMVVLDAMPLTHNGKLDRNQLRLMPCVELVEERVVVEPETPLERKIARILAQALGLKQVGRDENFFDLGGHSLLVVSVTEQLQNELGLSLSPGALFEQPTVRELAAYSTSALSDEPRPVLLSGDASRPALFMLGGVHLYRAFTRQMPGDYAIYGVYTAKDLMMFEDIAQAGTVPQIAEEYVRMIKRVSPSGPYRLAGMSFGGIVAFEVARQLQQANEQVVFLGLIDSALPWSSGLGGAVGRLRRWWQLSYRERLAALQFRMRARLQRVRGSSNALQFVREQADAKLNALEAKRQLAFATAARAYVNGMPRYDEEAVLVVAGRRLALDPLQDPRCGFSEPAPRLSVHTLDGNHLDLVEPPLVAMVASIFLEGLRRSETTRPTLAPSEGGADRLSGVAI